MTERIGLIGWPLDDAVSEAMHNLVFQVLNMHYEYDLLPTPPDQFEAGVQAALDEGYVGLSITSPYKRRALDLPQISQIEQDVAAVGAVDTLTRLRDGSLRASNTDWRGFGDDIVSRSIVVRGADCLILGTGGASRAVAYALAQRGAASITWVSRDGAGMPDAISYDELTGIKADLIVNATPVGGAPNVDESPWPTGISFPTGATVYDLIYNPAETRLMKQAKQAGLLAFGGLGMLVRQAAMSVTLWTGKGPPLGVMFDAARSALDHDAAAT
ncbi:MAG: shikimate dehydrogenase [Chloroflexi bacterium]|nr:shikimate dehydrogenase [Chloroflexota bacterium]